MSLIAASVEGRKGIESLSHRLRADLFDAEGQDYSSTGPDQGLLIYAPTPIRAYWPTT